jgi:hypothetical protein
MRALKVLVAVMGVLLLGGTVALVALVVARVQRGPAPAAVAPGPRHVEALLPAGGHIVATELAGDRLLVRVALADGTERLLLFDARTGAAVAVLDLHQEGAP